VPLLLDDVFIKKRFLAGWADIWRQWVVVATGFIWTDYSRFFLCKFRSCMYLSILPILFLWGLAHLTTGEFIHVVELTHFASPFWFLEHYRCQSAFILIILLQRVISLNNPIGYWNIE
jgi:hypothetical protein